MNITQQLTTMNPTKSCFINQILLHLPNLASPTKSCLPTKSRLPTKSCFTDQILFHPKSYFTDQISLDQLQPDGPTDGFLQLGDTITMVDGVAVADVGDITTCISRSRSHYLDLQQIGQSRLRRLTVVLDSTAVWQGGRLDLTMRAPQFEHCDTLTATTMCALQKYRLTPCPRNACWRRMLTRCTRALIMRSSKVEN
jgi:hypothetical protein